MTASLAGHKFASLRDEALHRIATAAPAWRHGGKAESPVGRFSVLHIDRDDVALWAPWLDAAEPLAAELAGSWVVTETIKLRDDGSVLIPATVFVGAFDRPHKADDEFDRLTGKYKTWLATEAEKAALASLAGDCDDCGELTPAAEIAYNGGYCSSCCSK